jgi:hypothetical protein
MPSRGADHGTALSKTLSASDPQWGTKRTVRRQDVDFGLAERPRSVALGIQGAM